ncbi:MAG: hypothetical protein IJ796_02435 [Lachnospiraceae bacterium]|nr:hypothetical protein [Lachnospiraceae bacterium]
MDTLMDKLAQKLNAQEMIRANGEAEAEQMNYLKAQVGEYQGCLDRLAKVCDELGNLETRIGNLSLPQNGAGDEAVAEIKSQLQTLAQSTDSQLKELSNSTGKKLDAMSEATENQIKNFSESTNRKLENMQGELLEKVGSEENLHKEGVRIYKNIQASMVNELEPLEETVKDSNKQVISSVKGVKILAIVAVVLSALTLIIQIAGLLGIV